MTEINQERCKLLIELIEDKLRNISPEGVKDEAFLLSDKLRAELKLEKRSIPQLDY